MRDFNESNWARPEFGSEYIEHADIYIVERKRLFEILKSFYGHFLWREWIEERQASLAVEGDFSDIIHRYKDNKDNRPDMLADQLSALREIGFTDVDCFYKYGIFSIYGGKKG